MSGNKLNNVYIKLGSDCNLRCKYCHAEKSNFQFNPEVLPELKKYGVKHIVFGGGEPLVYWDTIKQIVEYFGSDVTYRMVSNGTLFTDEIVDYCNEHRIAVSISMDGTNTTRDTSKPVQWEQIKKLWLCYTAVTFYKETSNIRESLESLNEVKEKYLTVRPFIWSSFPNFVHSTEKTGALSDRALAESYVAQMTELAEESFDLYVKSGGIFVTAFFRRLFTEFIKVKKTRGVACCNNGRISMLADGTICVCPYTYEKIGDIFHFDDIDWDNVKADYTHEKCKVCPIFNVCRNRCCMEITDNQCYIMREMNKNIKGLMEKYGVSYEEFYNKCNG